MEDFFVGELATVALKRKCEKKREHGITNSLERESEPFSSKVTKTHEKTYEERVFSVVSLSKSQALLKLLRTMRDFFLGERPGNGTREGGERRKKSHGKEI